MKVLVIGAGLGGLCLGPRASWKRHGRRGLRAPPRPHRGPPGIRHPPQRGGCAALRASLPAPIWALIDERAYRAGSTAGFYDQRLRPASPGSGTAQGPRRSIGRSALRDLLLTGLDDGTVRWGKEFVRYEDLLGGRVRAHFADGGHADGDLLVGADASNSRVRAQRLPHLRREDLGVISVAGRTAMTREATAGPPRPPRRHPQQRRARGSGVDVRLHLVRRNPGAADAPYVVWAYIGGRAGFPAGVEERSGAELRDLVLSRIATWSPALTALVRHGDPASVAPDGAQVDAAARVVAERQCHPARRRRPHHDPDGRAWGPHTALRDADALRRALLDVRAGRRDLLAAVSTYEEEMRGWANPALATSCRNAGSAATTNRLARGPSASCCGSLVPGPRGAEGRARAAPPLSPATSIPAAPRELEQWTPPL